MAKYLSIAANGRFTEVATATAGGTGNEGLIPTLGAADGRLADTMMPLGIGADTVVLPTSENLSANDVINIYNASGTMTARKADAGTNKYQAHGYVKAATTSPANATIYRKGECPGTFDAADAGKLVFVSATPGAATVTPVTGTGKLHQVIGSVSSTTGFNFDVEVPIELV